jgi:hypothetical protein
MSTISAAWSAAVDAAAGGLDLPLVVGDLGARPVEDAVEADERAHHGRAHSDPGDDPALSTAVSTAIGPAVPGHVALP